MSGGSTVLNSTTCPNICFRKALKGFGTVSEITKDVVNIAPAATSYDVKVLGQQVNEYNYKNFAVDGLTTGSVTYDKNNKVLKLNNVKIVAPTDNSEAGVWTRITGIQVTLAGKDTIIANGNAVHFELDGELNGDGKLMATSKNKHGLYFNNKYMTIKVNNTVRFKGKQNGYDGAMASGEELRLEKAGNNSDYYFSGDSHAMWRMVNLVLTDMDFYYSSNYGTPACYFDKSGSNGTIMQNGGTIVSGDKEVNFYNISSNYPRYDLYIAGTQVTGCNKYAVGSKYITAGGTTAVVYNTNSKTLTLNNATITNMGENMNALENSGIDALTINVVGDNTLMTERSGWNSNNTSVNLRGNTTITGNGTLNVKGVGPLFVTNGNTLTIKDAKKVVVESDIRSNSESSKAELVVDNSNVEAKYVYYFKSITWLNGSLAEPVNGKFDPTSTYIVDANGNHASRVVFIDQAATAIDAVEVDRDAGIRDIYDASGRQTQNARSGLNIIRMSDGTVRKVMVK